MRSLLSLPFAGALACCAASTHAAPAADPDAWTVYADAAAWQASDAVPIEQIDGDWTDYAPRAGRNVALMRSRAELGVERRGWRLGVEARQDAFLVTDRASLDAFEMYQHKRKPAPPSSFALQARYFSWQAEGLRVGHGFEAARIAGRPLSVDVSTAVYSRQRLRERSVMGTLSYPRADTYGFAVSHSDANDRMVYPFMDKTPRASGASLSLAASVPLAEAWTLHLEADDVASRLRWTDLPVNVETLNSNVSSVDADGYVDYRPLLSGRKQQLARSYRIPRYNAATLDYRNDNWGAAVQLARYAGTTIPTLSLSRRFGWLTLQGSLDTRFDSAGIGLEAGNFRFQLQSDSLDLSKAKARSLQLHYHLAF